MGNIVLGSDGITVRQGIYEQSLDAKAELGRFLDFEDGRRFRYCKAYGAITKGNMVQSPTDIDNHLGVAQTNYSLAVGDKDDIEILLTTTAPVAGEYVDGYLIVNSGTGLGQMYKIRKHDTGVDPCTLSLYDPILAVTNGAASDITIVKSRYRDVVVMPTTRVGPPIGVPLITISSGGYYFWAQSRGYAPLLVGNTLTIGHKAVYYTTSGTCGPSIADTDTVYGTVVYVATSTEYAVVDLHLE